jgi:hypothetical protein
MESFPAGYPSSTFADGMLGYVGYKTNKQGAEVVLTLKGNDYTIVTGLSYEKQKITDPSQKLNWNPHTDTPAPIQDFSDASTNFIDEVDI